MYTSLTAESSIPGNLSSSFSRTDCTCVSNASSIIDSSILLTRSRNCLIVVKIVAARASSDAETADNACAGIIRLNSDQRFLLTSKLYFNDNVFKLAGFDENSGYNRRVEIKNNKVPTILTITLNVLSPNSFYFLLEDL